MYSIGPELKTPPPMALAQTIHDVPLDMLLNEIQRRFFATGAPMSIKRQLSRALEDIKTDFYKTGDYNGG